MRWMTKGERARNPCSTAAAAAAATAYIWNRAPQSHSQEIKFKCACVSTYSRFVGQCMHMQKEKSVQSASAISDPFSVLFFSLTVWPFFSTRNDLLDLLIHFYFIYMSNIRCTTMVSIWTVCVCMFAASDIYYRCCSLCVLLLLSFSFIFIWFLFHILLKCSRFLILGKEKQGSRAWSKERKKRDNLLKEKRDEINDYHDVMREYENRRWPKPKIITNKTYISPQFAICCSISVIRFSITAIVVALGMMVLLQLPLI